MDKPNQLFTAEQVDEQTAHLLNQPPAHPDAVFLQEIRHYYQQERQTLESAWERLSPVLDKREHSEIKPDSAPKPRASRPFDVKSPESRRSRLIQPFAPLAAVLVGTLLISLFVGLFSWMTNKQIGVPVNQNLNPTLTSQNASLSKLVKRPALLTSGLRLHMVTEKVGWTIGSSPNGLNWASVLRTTDGGVSWKSVTPKEASSQGVHYLYILDETTAWLPGSGGWYRTTDGGANWKQLRWFGAEIQPFSFSDQDHGWMVVYPAAQDKSQPPSTTAPTQTNPLLYTTSDGGDTWKQAHTLPFLSIREFVAVTEQTGWVTASGITTVPTLDFNTSLYVTHDGGKTWEARQLKSPAGITAEAPSFTFGPSFVTEQDGFLFAAFGQNATSDMYLYSTHDGGKTWQPQGGAVPGYVGVRRAVDDQHIVVDIGGMGMDLMTLVDGQWRQLGTSPSKGDELEYSFPTASTGVALVTTRENDLDVYRTNDIAKTWQKIATLPAIS